MHPIADTLPDSPFFAGLSPEALALIAGCGHNIALETGEFLFREGEPADWFYLVRRGRVALELHGPGSGTIGLDTVEPGEVAGWSWLVPPHRWFFDARAVEPTGAVAFDGKCLRDKYDQDTDLGYALMQRVAHVMFGRLVAARLRLLDLYGPPTAAQSSDARDERAD
jgi:CRP-like cAMP-binding protein